MIKNETLFFKVRDNFLADKYEINSREFLDASKILHGNLISWDEIIPLLTSNLESCQTVATYIASEETSSCSIFGHVFALLDSPNIFIRYNVLDCFLSCATKPEHFVKLFELLNDPEQTIRLNAIAIFDYIDYKRIALIIKYTDAIPSLSELHKGLTLLAHQIENDLTYETIENHIRFNSKIMKIFYYLCARRQFNKSPELSHLANKSEDADILKYHSWYYA